MRGSDEFLLIVHACCAQLTIYYVMSHTAHVTSRENKSWLHLSGFHLSPSTKSPQSPHRVPCRCIMEEVQSSWTSSLSSFGFPNMCRSTAPWLVAAPFCPHQGKKTPLSSPWSPSRVRPGTVALFHRLTLTQTRSCFQTRSGGRSWRVDMLTLA